jgi:hypothetical protein
LYRARASRLPRGKHGLTENVLASLVDGAAYTPVSAARELLRRSRRSCSFALQGNKLSAYSLTIVAINPAIRGARIIAGEGKFFEFRRNAWPPVPCGMTRASASQRLNGRFWET